MKNRGHFTALRATLPPKFLVRPAYRIAKRFSCAQVQSSGNRQHHVCGELVIAQGNKGWLQRIMTVLWDLHNYLCHARHLLHGGLHNDDCRSLSRYVGKGDGVKGLLWLERRLCRGTRCATVSRPHTIILNGHILVHDRVQDLKLIC